MADWNLPYQFNFDGREVRYGVAGEGEPLVLVHGTPWSSFNLRHLIRRLAQHYQVYYFDLLGYGASDKRDGDVSLAVQNRLLQALLQHWQLESPGIIGHDFGGTTVLRNHILDQHHFRKIVLIDPVALSPWGSPFFRHVEQYEEAFSGLPDYIHRAVVEAYVKTAAYNSLDQATLDGILAPWMGDDGKAAFYRQIAQADSAYTDEFQHRFTEVSAPVLILWGEEDQWIPLVQAERLQSKIPGARLVTVPQAGHLVIEEKPEELAAAIEVFLRD